MTGTTQTSSIINYQLKAQLGYTERKTQLNEQPIGISQRENLLFNRVVDNWNRFPTGIISVDSKSSKKRIEDVTKIIVLLL